MRAMNKLKRGFTLVELMIVVAIVGVLAALAIYGVSRYLRSAKTAEARNSVGQLAKDAAAAFSRETMSGAVLALGGVAAPSSQICPSVTATVPAASASIQGQKYQSNPTEWSAAGWPCLRFSMDQPQYYMYNYVVTGSLTAAGGSFVASASGDLDADTTLSTFSMSGAIAGTNELVVVLSPGILETNPDE